MIEHGDTRDCPLCGGTMCLRESTTVAHIPGYEDAPPARTREWVCLDCDYFEDAEREEA